MCIKDKNRKGAQLLGNIPWRKGGGDGGAMKNTACTSIARAASSRKFTTCSRTPIEFYNGGSLSNSLIGYISLDENAHERAPPLILDRICRRLVPNSQLSGQTSTMGDRWIAVKPGLPNIFENNRYRIMNFVLKLWVNYSENCFFKSQNYI